MSGSPLPQACGVHEGERSRGARDAHADLIVRDPVGATLDRVMDELRAEGVVPA